MKINDREYTIPELNFNAMCELEDLGASFSEMDKKALSTVRAFLALAMGGDAEKAGKEIEAHIASGGKFDDIMQDINRAVEESGFFGLSRRERRRKLAAARRRRVRRFQRAGS